MLWVLAATTLHCKVLGYRKNPAAFDLLLDITLPETRNRPRPPAAAKPVRVKSRGLNNQIYQAVENIPKRSELKKFAFELTKNIQRQTSQKGYDKLIIIASPRMLQLLFKLLSKQTLALAADKAKKALIASPKNLTDMTPCKK